MKSSEKVVSFFSITLSQFYGLDFTYISDTSLWYYLMLTFIYKFAFVVEAYVEFALMLASVKHCSF